MEENHKDIAEIHFARVKKMNKTHHAIVANFTLKKEIDNSFKVGEGFKTNIFLNHELSHR